MNHCRKLLMSTLLSAAAALSSTLHAEDITLQQGQFSIAVDPQYGGRITELRLADTDLLALEDRHANNFGSTFWLSPQALWNWPPVAEHDSAPYQVKQSGDNFLHMESAAGAGTRVAKTIVLEGEGHTRLDYRIIAEQPFHEIAAWEITRVANRGLAFAPVNGETVKTVRGQMDFELDNSEVLWLPMSGGGTLTEGKVIANGSEGWLAYAVDGLLYLKIYPHVSTDNLATGEGDIELYLSGEKPYLELEVQSAAQALAAGDALDWSVNWLLLPIPAEVKVTPGSSALLTFTRQQVNRLRTPNLN
ncbi:DUF4380 domain-containing protein [Microbulbifer aggregans]|uniref:DUF4380 domain-containing protein n=1 Tax=Microbulbifer aggregans TaxID=1769779 RepID=UPI001CFDA707|nr:DUF4380 domain-containing protein [Microbulbifer aggregans]